MDPLAKRESLVDRHIIIPGTDPFRSIVYGGSMAYRSVRESSDIDLLVVTDRDSIGAILNHPYFVGTIEEPVSRAFEDSQIGFFWASKEIDGVKMNVFVYDAASLELFSLLRSDLVGFRKDPPSPRRGYSFGGSLFEVETQRPERFGDGWIYMRPALNKGAYYGGVPRDQFWFLDRVIVDDGWYTDLAQRSRRAVVERLVEEHGPGVDLTEYNVLNTIHAYHERRDRVSDTKFDLIRAETRQLLERS